MVLLRIGGKTARKRNTAPALRELSTSLSMGRVSIYVAIAAISVASVPNMISGRAAPPRILAMRQPMVTPGTAAGRRAGNTVSISLTRHCTGPKLMGINSMLRAV